MTKKHMKRLAAPKSWPIKRKQGKFTVKPYPSGHSIELSLPICTIIRELLGYAENTRQVKKILLNSEVLIDGKRVKDAKRAAGLMDVISFPKTNENFRIKLNKKGKLALEKTDSQKQKTCKITGKRTAKGNKIQLTLHDGRTLTTEDNSYKTGDSVQISIPEQKINKHLKLEKGSTAYITGGKHAGTEGTVEKIEKDELLIKADGKEFGAKKRFAFIVEKK